MCVKVWQKRFVKLKPKVAAFEWATASEAVKRCATDKIEPVQGLAESGINL